MFRQPEAVKAQAFGMACQIKRVGKGLRRRLTFGHGRQIEHGIMVHGIILSRQYRTDATSNQGPDGKRTCCKDDLRL